MAMSLEAARVNAKLSRKEACKALDIHDNTLRSYERYKTKPNIDMAKQMVALYGCEWDDINWEG